MMLVRADVDADMVVMMSTGYQRHMERMNTWFNPRRNFYWLVTARGGLMRLILFWRRRSEQDDSDDIGDKVIGAVLKAREARGKPVESLIDAWQCMDDQMRIIPTALCRSLENLHGDMSYVLIRGLMWKIRWRQ